MHLPLQTLATTSWPDTNIKHDRQEVAKSAALHWLQPQDPERVSISFSQLCGALVVWFLVAKALAKTFGNLASLEPFSPKAFWCSWHGKKGTAERCTVIPCTRKTCPEHVILVSTPEIFWFIGKQTGRVARAHVLHDELLAFLYI